MRLCNCGEIMKLDDIIGDEISFYCLNCHATLVIKNGDTKWQDENGRPGTYQPPEKGTRRKSENSVW